MRRLIAMAAAVVMAGCLTRDGAMKVGGVGVVTVAGSMVGFAARDCDDALSGGGGGGQCGDVTMGATLTGVVLGAALVAGAVINLFDPVEAPVARDDGRPPYVPSRARYLMASAGVLARRGDCVGARRLAERAYATDPVVAKSYAGDDALTACYAAR